MLLISCRGLGRGVAIVNLDPANQGERSVAQHHAFCCIGTFYTQVAHVYLLLLLQLLSLNRVPYKADVDIGEIASLQVGTHCEHCHWQ
jgi:hypothetical protein